MHSGYLLKEVHLPGPEQMSIDIMLLEESIKESNISMGLRFYTWEGQWISIGKHQKDIPKHWKELASQNIINIVRRPSGGKAVLHSGGLTYALIWNDAPRTKKQSYLKINQWLIESFSSIGLELILGSSSPYNLPKNCFSSATFADLIDICGRKRVGSAQYWKKGNLLQHGEILLSPPKDLWEEIFKDNPPKNADSNISKMVLRESLIKTCKRMWSGISWKERTINSNELNIAKNKARNYLIDL